MSRTAGIMRYALRFTPRASRSPQSCHAACSYSSIWPSSPSNGCPPNRYWRDPLLTRQIVLETEHDNAVSLALYGSLGFLREKRLARFYSNGKDA